MLNYQVYYFISALSAPSQTNLGMCLPDGEILAFEKSSTETTCTNWNQKISGLFLKFVYNFVQKFFSFPSQFSGKLFNEVNSP